MRCYVGAKEKLKSPESTGLFGCRIRRLGQNVDRLILQ